MRVTFFQRRPQGGNFSVERLFTDVRNALPDTIEARVAVSRFPSKGVLPRLYNIFEAMFRQGDVNHVTGDVHFLALLLRKKRTVLTVLDLVTVHRLKGIRKSVLFFFWYWLPVKRCAVVTTISNFTRDELLRHVRMDSRKIRVVHCPVSSAFKPVPKAFNATNPVILQIGTKANKNLERLAEALEDIPCHLRIIGSIGDKQAKVLERCGIAFSSVSSISDDEMVDEYRRCDMLAFASTYEGFGLPIVEAQATGRPVVTSNSMSMPEVAGGAACLVNPFETESIRQGILKVIRDNSYREELVRKGFENVERFQAVTIARQYASLYEELFVQAQQGENDE